MIYRSIISRSVITTFKLILIKVHHLGHTVSNNLLDPSDWMFLRLWHCVFRVKLAPDRGRAVLASVESCPSHAWAKILAERGLQRISYFQSPLFSFFLHSHLGWHAGVELGAEQVGHVHLHPQLHAQPLLLLEVVTVLSAHPTTVPAGWSWSSR